jgi:predicted Fe-Mo cluster-binding NifX family protein
MKIAIPLANGQLSMHFGHCQQVTLVETDPDLKQIVNIQLMSAPPHQPGLLPEWLHEHGAQVIIARGMGQRAQEFFTAKGIDVVLGAPSEAPEAIVLAYLNGKLQTGSNPCDH